MRPFAEDDGANMIQHDPIWLYVIIGFGRIVALETEPPILLANLE